VLRTPLARQHHLALALGQPFARSGIALIVAVGAAHAFLEQG